ncbi:uncharacterized protein DNG_04675 [Cephalotrichum gorgonifer]|uniref:Uncharacterized protein n=1 Tax=Cephalotrichum gorgonifer TaxID=2041049 RepID=A0AAE8MWT3_9PEZI|nr:uncharacterized protein DNG_04675 [Cephalotrichum gorgonifer]
MEDLLDEGDAILNPQKHDDLLFDDSTFSRSRRYFWAADSLDTFLASISDTLNQWNMWWEAWEPIIRNAERMHKLRFEARSRSEPKSSASSVMESREATDLGKTVKLLTYVSIFYLPLGVCAAMFSIDPDFGLTLFGVVTVVTAVTTYFIVANLESIIHVLRRTPQAIKTPLVDKMAQDGDEEWKRRGQGLRDARPDRADATPSGWRIVQYAGVRLARVFGRLGRWKRLGRFGPGKELEGELP